MSTRLLLPGERGRWFRHGGGIVLMPWDAGAGDDEVQGELPAPVTATRAGVIDGRIDVHAQYALLRMARSPDPGVRADASAMLGAVKSGTLAGIYKEDQQVPALRARAQETSWWLVIPKGEDAALFLGAAPGEAPLIVFRDGVRSNAVRLDPALRKAWASFITFTTPGGRCGVQPPDGTIAEARPAGVSLLNVFPRLVCQGKAPPRPRPRPVAELRHFHRRRAIPGGAAVPPSGAPLPMIPEAMNPGYIDDSTGQPMADSTLQRQLEVMLETHYPAERKQMSVAVVDLTGPRLFAPAFAGWYATRPVEGASLPKMCAVYAARQLTFDLQTIAAEKKITTIDPLAEAMKAEWAAAELPESRQPAVKELFTFSETSVGPVLMANTFLERLISCTIGNCNWSASLLIDRVGFAYIASVLRRSGLFDPRRSGLWLKAMYDTTCACTDRSCCLHGRLRDFAPVYAPGLPHNATALSAAMMLTLLAQDRLPEPEKCIRLRADLDRSCSLFIRGKRGCPSTLLGKCGSSNGFQHDCALVQPSSREACATGAVTYVVVLLTVGVRFTTDAAKEFFGPFLERVDKVIRTNNPPPPPPSPFGRRHRR